VIYIVEWIGLRLTERDEQVGGGDFQVFMIQPPTVLDISECYAVRVTAWNLL
jgi:hypothetical protein